MTLQPAAWVWPDSTLDRIVDGDTLVARVTRDIGFYGSTSFLVHFRLDGINAPPIKTAAGADAATALLQLLAAPFTLISGKPYKYRAAWMATVTLADGRDVSQAMIDAGHAVAWDGRGTRPGG